MWALWNTVPILKNSYSLGEQVQRLCEIGEADGGWNLRFRGAFQLLEATSSVHTVLTTLTRLSQNKRGKSL
jgi:hypothetical protein